jgi:SAM-dependent methyltransferase
MKFDEAVGSKPINDEGSYVSQMGKAFIDKLFFMDKVDADLIVDFGCADGFILSKIAMLKPGTKLVGYDLDKGMLAKARENLGDQVILTSDWDEVEGIASISNRPLLLLSSVIHEVYSYSTTRDIQRFWRDQVFGGSFKWICIRDMIPSGDLVSEEDFTSDVEKVKSIVDPRYIKSFENKWGPLSDNYRTFIHFLLKYRYVENWEREVEENYVPITLRTLKSKMSSSYMVAYENSYIYDFFQMQVRQDLGIEIKQTTHTKMIIERVK